MEWISSNSANRLNVYIRIILTAVLLIIYIYQLTQRWKRRSSACILTVSYIRLTAAVYIIHIYQLTWN